jgi:hypothetical protein
MRASRERCRCPPAAPLSPPGRRRPRVRARCRPGHNRGGSDLCFAAGSFCSQFSHRRVQLSVDCATHLDHAVSEHRQASSDLLLQLTGTRPFKLRERASPGRRDLRRVPALRDADLRGRREQSFARRRSLAISRTTKNKPTSSRATPDTGQQMAASVKAPRPYAGRRRICPTRCDARSTRNARRATLLQPMTSWSTEGCAASPLGARPARR